MASALSVLAKGFLAFSHGTLIVPLLFAGLLTELFRKEKGLIVWKIACLLVLFAMALNIFLKSIFLVPLNPALGKEGFAFPSGHMQVSVTLYGWLFWVYTHRLVRTLLVVILVGIGYGLIHEGYHTLADVVAAVGAGVATLYGVVRVMTLLGIKNNLPPLPPSQRKR